MKKSLFSIFIPREPFIGLFAFLASLFILWTAPATALVVKWEQSLPLYASSSMSMGPDQSLYVPIHNGTTVTQNKIYRIMPDGSTADIYSHYQGIREEPIIAPDGTIYIRTCTGAEKLIALTPDFNEKWSVLLDEQIQVPAVGHDGTIYYIKTKGSFNNPGSKLFALNPDNGTTKWVCTFSDKNGNYENSPMIAPDGTLYISMAESHLIGGTVQSRWKIFAVQSNGILKWEASFPERVSLYMMGVGSDGTLYIRDWLKNQSGIQGLGFKAIDPTDGSTKWSLSFNPLGNPYPAMAIGADDTIYIAGTYQSNSKMLFVTPNGTIKRSISLPSGVQAGPTMGADGTIYIIGSDNYLRAINSHTGTQKWAHYVPNVSQKYHPVIAPDGTIYVGGSDLNQTTLYALESNDSPCLDCVWASFRGNNRRTGEGAKSALTPRLITPQNFQEISLQNAANANFQWKPMGGNPTYRIEIAGHPSFLPNLGTFLSGNTPWTNVSINLTNLLPTENSEYFWRIKASTPDGLYSPYRSFVYGDKTQMIRPIIKSPVYDAVLKSPVHLEWEHPGATNYRVLILTEPVWRPETVVHDQILSDTHLDKEFTTYRTYYMAVCSNIANSKWSFIYKFQVVNDN